MPSERPVLFSCACEADPYTSPCTNFTGMEKLCICADYGFQRLNSQAAPG